MSLGTLLLVAGVLMLALPGPGWITIAAGLAILAKDVAWAERALDRVRRRLPADADGSVDRRVVVISIIVAVVAVAGVDLVDVPEVSSPTAAIRLEDVSKTFPGRRRPAVGDLSVTMPEGQLTVLVGPSGCGKTTTLKMINRLIEPTGGRIEVLGTDVRDLPVHELRRQIGYVIQQIGLFPHKTIAENIATVPKLLGWDKARDQGPGRRADRAGRPRPRAPVAVPGGAVRRPAAAGRRGPGAGGGPADPAHGRAVLGGRPHRAGPAAGRAARACRSSCARRSSSSPTTSTRPSSSATRSPSSTSAASSSRRRPPRRCCGSPPTTSSPASSARSGG